MKQFAALLSLLLFSAATYAAPPSEESINRLLEDLHAEKVMDAVKPQMENFMKQIEQQASNGEVPSAEDQKVIDKFHHKVIAIMSEALTFEKLRPMYVRLYSENFTQEEIDGLTAFLESPAGKAYVTKLPKVVQAVMAEMPSVMAPMMQQTRDAGTEMYNELNALHDHPAK